LNRIVSDVLLSQLSEFVTAYMGLHFPKERRHDLERGICSAAGEFGFDDVELCIQWLMSTPLTKKQVEILASYLTVGETYFFRDKKSFEILKEHILPEIIRSRSGTEKHLRIWSAACATGEEPYSIAISLCNMIPDLREWNIMILATDINPRFLQKASEGIYNEWSFRDTLPGVKLKNFKKTNEGHYAILPHVKKLVTFSYLNLVEDVYPSLLNNTNAMDLIFCRNVLMYFSQNSHKKVIQNLYRCLMDGGWLIVSPCETSHVLFSQFQAVNFQGITFYKKQVAGLRDQGPGIRDYEEVVKQQLTTIPELQTSGPEMEYKTGDLICEISPPSTDHRPPTPNLYTEALMLHEKGCYPEAAEKIAILLSQGRDEPKVMLLMARVYANQGKLSDALELCEKAIAADKLNPGSHYLHATILQEQNRIEEAQVSLKRVLYLDQNFILAHFALGILNKQQGKLRESEKHFENALSLLSAYRQEDILPESEGMTAGRLQEIITTMKMQDVSKDLKLVT
jgi:chemotaxis protein methyltransferase CheR